MNFSKLTLALVGSILCLSAFASLPDTDDPTSFVGPTLRLGFTNTITENTAYSVAGEAGPKNYRIGATYGWQIAEDQRFKMSADYLWQNITYSFFSGNTDQWVQQYSFGAAFQYDFLGYNFAPQLDLNGYYAHATSKNLSSVTGIFINSLGVPTVYVDQRRIAGSSDTGLAPGLSAMFWDGGRIGFYINYDRADYNTENITSNDHDAHGVGGSIWLTQTFAENIDLNLSAGVRKPFDLYSANLSYNHVQFYGDWRLGLFGDYVNGKYSLPNTWNVGLSADYMLDTRCPLPARTLKGDFKGESVPVADNLLAWTSTPAVYLPQVLAIADGKTTFPGCPDGAVPTFIGTIPDLTSNTGSFSVASFFTGNNLIYAVSTTTPLAVGDTISINSAGVITYSFTNNPPYDVIVTATNRCGSITSNTFTLGSGIG